MASDAILRIVRDETPAKSGQTPRADFGVFIRNVFVNRDPFLARFAWRQAAPGDRCREIRIPVPIGPDESTVVLPDNIEWHWDRRRFLPLQMMVDAAELSLFDSLRETVPACPHDESDEHGCWPLWAIIRAMVSIRAGMSKKASKGNADVVLVSPDWFWAVCQEGHAIVKADAGQTPFGVPIKVFNCPFLGRSGPSIIEMPLFRPKTAAVLTSKDVAIAWDWLPHFDEHSDDLMSIGEWVCSLALDVRNLGHHRWIEGGAA